MKISTHLISGAGNTFHIMNSNQNRQIENLSVEQKKKMTREICREKKADGFIFLSKKTEYHWSFYNNDGSDAEMCGNATRCVGYYIKNVMQDPGSQWPLKTTAGPITISCLSKETYQISMTPIITLISKHGFFFDTGVPHLIQEIDIFENFIQQKDSAAQLRFHADFQPRGTNVTYVHFLKDLDQLQAVSYERGVENFTNACGTGAMAAAMFNLIKRGSVKTTVEMPGGTLMMDLTDIQKPQMTGPAVSLGKFDYEVSI